MMVEQELNRPVNATENMFIGFGEHTEIIILMV